MPRRRSARLRGEPVKENDNARSSSAIKLSSLLERDETPQNMQSLDTVVSTPVGPDTLSMPGAFEEDSPPQTPQSSGSLPKPSHSEMHPSKIVHQSNKISPTKFEMLSEESDLPSQGGFDFSWGRPESDLSIEAQKIMESVREEAARIKEQIQIERDAQARRDEEADAIESGRQTGGRKMLTPRRKTGRFSDAHREAFKKMDSIAGHGSVLKHQGNSALRSPGSGLLKRKQSPPVFHQATQGSASPGKRLKTHTDEDVPMMNRTPPQRRIEQVKSSPIKSSAVALPSVATTPTKASLARAASAKCLKTTSKIPALTHSHSIQHFGQTASPISKTHEASATAQSASPLRTVASLKSILHKPHLKFSDDPLKVAAGTHLPMPKQMDGSGPSTPMEATTGTPSVVGSPSPKRVNFSSSTKGEGEISASASKEVTVATGNAVTELSPTKIPTRPLPQPPVACPSPPKVKAQVAYPSIGQEPTAHPHPLGAHPPSKGAGAFTFRHPHPAPAFSTATGSTTIRRVRPSGMPTPIAPNSSLSRAVGNANSMAASRAKPLPSPPKSTLPTSPVTYPSLKSSTNETMMARMRALPAVPAEVPSKKRRRPIDDEGNRSEEPSEGADDVMIGSDGSDRENRAPGTSSGNSDGPPHAKKIKVGSLALSSFNASDGSVSKHVQSPTAHHVRSGLVSGSVSEKSSKLFGMQRRFGLGGHAPTSSGIAALSAGAGAEHNLHNTSVKKERKGLSLSRLNMLARPKERR